MVNILRVDFSVKRWAAKLAVVRKRKTVFIWIRNEVTTKYVRVLCNFNKNLKFRWNENFKAKYVLPKFALQEAGIQKRLIVVKQLEEVLKELPRALFLWGEKGTNY